MFSWSDGGQDSLSGGRVCSCHSGHWGAFQSGISPIYIQIRITIPQILLISLVVENLWEYGLENVGKFVKYSSAEYCDRRHLIGLRCGIFQIFHKIFHS